MVLKGDHAEFGVPADFAALLLRSAVYAWQLNIHNVMCCRFMRALIKLLQSM